MSALRQCEVKKDWWLGLVKLIMQDNAFDYTSHSTCSDGNKVLLSVRSFFAKKEIAPAGAP